MKSIRTLFLAPVICFFLVLCSCDGEPAPSKTKKYLFHPPQQQIELVGSVLKVDDGILVLVQNGPLKEIPTIIIPANDSAGRVMRDAYTTRTDHQYQASLEPWVKLTGSFIREDSLSPIFKYNYVILLDKNAGQQEIREMEE